MDKFRNILRKYKFLVNVLAFGIGVVLLFVASFIKPEISKVATKGAEVTYDIMINIGGSVTATAALTLFLLALLQEDIDNDKSKKLEEWGICCIYRERWETALTEKKLPKKQLDFIAFDLKHFRENNKGEEADIIRLLERGLNIRIITVYPESRYVIERQQLEKTGGLKEEILALEEWKNLLLKCTRKDCKGNIQIKYYNNSPLDFYCRADNKVFVGPYMPGETSGTNITYEFKAEDTRGGKYYSQFFDDLWDGKFLDFIDYSNHYLVGDQKEAVENALKYFCSELSGVDGGKKIIGIVVIFKGEKRRTIFSCNKRMGERHHCYLKGRGTVGGFN